MTTLAEQVAAIRAGDRVTATFKDAWGDFVTSGGKVRTPHGTRDLIVGGHTILGPLGTVPESVVSIDAHEPSFQVGDWVRVSEDYPYDEVSGKTWRVHHVDAHGAILDLGGTVRHALPASRAPHEFLTRTEKPAPPEPAVVEPTSLGAVVEDATGGVYIRTDYDAHTFEPWQAANSSETYRWSNIGVRRVLSWGVDGIPAEARDALVSEYVERLDASIAGYVDWQAFQGSLRELVERATGGQS